MNTAYDAAHGSSKKRLTVADEVLHVWLPKEFYSGTLSVPRFHYVPSKSAHPRTTILPTLAEMLIKDLLH